MKFILNKMQTYSDNTQRTKPLKDRWRDLHAAQYRHT